MLRGLKDNFNNGVDRLRWFAGVFSERLKVEVVTVKLLSRREEMNRKREELLKKIGQRVCEMKSDSERNVFKDKTITDAIEEIEKTDRAIREIRERVAEINGDGA